VLQREVVEVQQGFELGGEALRLEKIVHAQALARDLVFVRRPDAAPGGPDRAGAAAGLAGAVERHVHGQDQRTGLADTEALARCHARALEHGDFLEQRLRREHHAVADHALRVLMQDARRDEVQDRAVAVDDQRVPGVVPALEAHHRIRLGREQVDDLALALVAPLGAQHHDAAAHD
jgi:hypothetical protein